MSAFTFRDKWRCDEMGFYSLDAYAGWISPGIERTSTFPPTTGATPRSTSAQSPETPAPGDPKIAEQAPETSPPGGGPTTTKAAPETPPPGRGPTTTRAPVSENYTGDNVDATTGNQRQARGRDEWDDRPALRNEHHDGRSTPNQEGVAGVVSTPGEIPLDTPQHSELPDEAKCCAGADHERVLVLSGTRRP
ncbi:unnamed protein product [Amoebophrya sp. A120]|nr:unnamed protein product [Amoebophrya sp. A120]|eukprot:GSA120T00013540001.1